MNKNLTSAIIIGFFVDLAFASPQRFSAVLLLSIVVGVMSFFKWLLTRTSIECMRVIKQPILPNNNKKVDKVNKVSKTFRIFVAVNKQNRKVFMITTATRKTAPDTFTLTVPKADVSFFKTMAKKMGWTVERKKAAKPRLYDPETGDYLNDATMKVIEDARKGKNVIEVGSMDDYLKLVNNL